MLESPGALHSYLHYTQFQHQILNQLAHRERKGSGRADISSKNFSQIGRYRNLHLSLKAIMHQSLLIICFLLLPKQPLYILYKITSAAGIRFVNENNVYSRISFRGNTEKEQGAVDTEDLFHDFVMDRSISAKSCPSKLENIYNDITHYSIFFQLQLRINLIKSTCWMIFRSILCLKAVEISTTT